MQGMIVGEDSITGTGDIFVGVRQKAATPARGAAIIKEKRNLR